MKSLSYKILPSVAGMVLSNFLFASPMDPSEKDVNGLFSTDVQRAFTLYADHEDPSLVWYVAKVGNLRLEGVGTSNPRPRFSVNARIGGPFDGLFFGQEIVYLGGAFDTTGNVGDLNRLEDEAAAQGLRVSAAPAAKASTKFITTGFEVGNDGRIDTNCVMEEVVYQGYTSSIPVCTALDINGNEKKADFLYKFQAVTPTGASTVSTNIPFQGSSYPDWRFYVEDLMYSGSNWDDLLQAVTDWELTTESKTRVARINIDWTRTFEQASTFAAYHNWSCVDIEVKTFFRRLLDNQDGSSGITVEYLQEDGSYSSTPSNDDQFNKVVEGVYKEMRDELFAEMSDYGQSQLGPVSTKSRSLFTLRANYEKLVFKRQEQRYVSWNPGTSISNARTAMNIQCIRGGFGTQVTWDVEDPACRDIAGMD